MKAERVNALTEEQIEQMATEIREFLLEHEMWEDVEIYFNGKCFTTYDRVKNEYHYNDREHLIVAENEDPRTYIEYVNPKHILSMSFEGTLCGILNYHCDASELKKKFDDIFTKYGVYYELGHHWNLSCYYI